VVSERWLVVEASRVLASVTLLITTNKYKGGVVINVVLEGGAASCWFVSPAFQRRYRGISQSVEDRMNNLVGRRRWSYVLTDASQVRSVSLL